MWKPIKNGLEHLSQGSSTLHQGSSSACRTGTGCARCTKVVAAPPGRRRGQAGGTGFAIAAGSEGASSPAQAAAAAMSIGSPLLVDRGRGRWRRGGGCGGSAGGGGGAGSSSPAGAPAAQASAMGRRPPRLFFACVRTIEGSRGKAEALTVFSSRACVLKAEGHYSSKKKRLKDTTVFSRGREYEI